MREISDLAAANAFAPEFMADYNRRFACAPRSEHDAHRLLQSSDDLACIFMLAGDALRLEEPDTPLQAGALRLARRARATGNGLPERARRAGGRSRREQAARRDDGVHQGETARAVHDPAQGAPVARRNAAPDRNGRLPSASTLTDGKRKADISTLEKTGHLYFAPTGPRTY